jgi:sugar lactone lactonase YvrE
MSFLHSSSDTFRTLKAWGSRTEPGARRRDAYSRLRLELLEARNLLSVYAANRLTDSPSADFIYWTDVDDLRRANLDGSGQQTVVTGLNGPDRIALDPGVGQMYWTDYLGRDIRRANLDGSGQQTLLSGLGVPPTGIALDVTGGHMYWAGGTSPNSGDIRRANLDGSGQQTLVTSLAYPLDIALDLGSGKMYWTDIGSGDIRRANLDGSGQQTLVSGLNGPSGMALDLAAGQIYWTDYVGGYIRRANLDGSGQQTLVTGLNGPNGVALDLSAGDMYWLNELSGDVRRANLDGSGQQSLVTGQIYPFGIALQLEPAPIITCSVADSLLWPLTHSLVNVGLSVNVDPPDASLHLLVYANANASPSDAADIGSDTLRLRAERQGNGDGRVYLIVATATNAAGTSFDVCTVAVPHDQSPRSIAAVQQQAADTDAYYREFQTAPPGFHLLGEGPASDGTSGAAFSPQGADAFRSAVNTLGHPAVSANQPLTQTTDSDRNRPANAFSDSDASSMGGALPLAEEQLSPFTWRRLGYERATEMDGRVLEMSFDDDQLVIRQFSIDASA